jgi:hypothetical protein
MIKVELKDALVIKQETKDIVAEIRFVNPVIISFESKPWREYLNDQRANF